MGTFFSKRQSVEFALIPSEEISGPLGLGDPESKEITKVEEESIIPALMQDRLRTKQCAKLWDEWSNCTQKYYWAAMYICKTDFHKALECNKRYLQDPQFFEEMKNLYLKMRSNYRRTGLEQRVVRTDKTF
ncbi:COX assembly mitochondrial protein 1 [Schistosoma bovis]|uniref:COX assembly mitochondrial protein n=1 Tax=Schistosoma bovis TaxID=6184 RepID=A0A430Q1B8_SCHBO|nr:COX assembly mitochondrial protein 1 [Schistosoma bovis]